MQGFGGAWIALRRVLPNVTPIVGAQSTLNFGYVLAELAALSFLGLGVQPPTADWGAMINEAQAGLVGRPLPARARARPSRVVIVVVAVNIIGEELSRPRSEAGITHEPPRHRQPDARPSPTARACCTASRSASSAGETVGLVGESGSGKSLTARSVLGLLPDRRATTGSVLVDGIEVLAASDRERARRAPRVRRP